MVMRGTRERVKNDSALLPKQNVQLINESGARPPDDRPTVDCTWDLGVVIYTADYTGKANTVDVRMSFNVGKADTSRNTRNLRHSSDGIYIYIYIYCVASAHAVRPQTGSEHWCTSNANTVNELPPRGRETARDTNGRTYR